MVPPGEYDSPSVPSQGTIRIQLDDGGKTGEGRESNPLRDDSQSSDWPVVFNHHEWSCEPGTIRRPEHYKYPALPTELPQQNEPHDRIELSPARYELAVQSMHTQGAKWSSGWDFRPRPHPYKGFALYTELPDDKIDGSREDRTLKSCDDKVWACCVYVSPYCRRDNRTRTDTRFLATHFKRVLATLQHIPVRPRR